MAPEILQQRGYEFSADWWAVGIMMYEMKFGYTPFYNKRKAFQDQAILNGELEFPNQARAPHSEEFIDLVSQLLHKDRNDRIGAEGGAD